MKKVLSFVIALLVCASVWAQPTSKIKQYNLATAGSSISINLASDVQIFFASGTKTLSAPYSVGVSGSAVDGKTILLFWDGTSLTTGGNTVTLLGVALNDKQATSKLLVFSVYKSSAWETRIVNDAKTTQWITATDFGTGSVNDTSIEASSYGLRVKALGIKNSHINASAGITYSKLNLTGSVVSADLAGSIAVNKLVGLTANRVPYLDANGWLAASSATSTELGYLAGVTSAIQTQINTKPTSGSIVNADISGSAAVAYSKLNLTGSVLSADLAGSIAWSKMATLTASKVPYINASGILTASTVTDTELGYLSGVTSNVQTQLSAARSSQTYTKSSSATIVLSSSATDAYILNTTSNTIAVTLPNAADFPANHVISFTRTFTGGANAVTISPYSGNTLQGATGADVGSYSLSGSTGEGVEFVGNGLDSFVYLKKW